MELIYLVEKIEEEYKIIGIADRKLAEKANLRHLTTICVPFICDDGKDEEGNDVKGNWIVHNRYHKQAAKGEECPPESYNLFGGHCTTESIENIGSVVSESILFDGIRRELNEELLRKKTDEKDKIIKLEVWENGSRKMKNKKIVTIDAAQYHVPLFSIIPVGYTEYDGGSNREYSYVFALPVPYEAYKNLVAADDYEKNAKKHNIFLPVKNFSESRLKELNKIANIKSHNLADAVFRLFEPQNEKTLIKLREKISEYCDTRG